MNRSDAELEALVTRTLVAVAQSEREPERLMTTRRQGPWALRVALVALLVVTGGVLLHRSGTASDTVVTGAADAPASLLPRTLRLDNGMVLAIQGARRYVDPDTRSAVNLVYLGSQFVTVDLEVRTGAAASQAPRHSCSDRRVTVRGHPGTLSGSEQERLELRWTEPGLGAVRVSSVALSDAELLDLAASLTPVTGGRWLAQVDAAGVAVETGPPPTPQPIMTTTTSCD